MTNQIETPPAISTRPSSDPALDRALVDRLGQLAKLFGTEFSVMDAKSGDLLLRAAHTQDGDWLMRGELVKHVASRSAAEIIEDDGDVLLLAIPLVTGKSADYVAVASFATESQPAVGTSSGWSGERLMSCAELVVERDIATSRGESLVEHLDEMSGNLSSTYEEISLLHRLTANLDLSSGVEDVANLVLEWLHEVVPAESFAAYLRVTGKPEEVLPEDGQRPMLLTKGVCPVDSESFERIVEHLELSPTKPMAMLDDSATSQNPWCHTSIRQLTVVSLMAGNKVLGYLAAFNHTEGGTFGTVEASMLNSVATILGIHSGNIELYRAQVQLLSGMVRAMVSAIDAKDPYTCGHSNRVARVSLRLAEQLKCSDHLKNTIYLAGLLHDIGKIGIDDSILRKPGKLTEPEYDQIKRHPELGYNILHDIDRIKDVLPGVLHHHEAWDGTGYPRGLAAADIPMMARIIAVADSFDAMGSDRPYRQGMDDAKLDNILRNGAGTQWDAEVIDAFFAARDDIREIADSERDHLHLDMHDFA